MKPQNFDHLAEKVRNWGRWGAEDQRGTLNHIGPETLKDAVATVQSGKLFNLGLNFDKNGPQPGTGGRFNPTCSLPSTPPTRTSSIRTTSCTCRCRRPRNGTLWATCTTTGSSITAATPVNA